MAGRCGLDAWLATVSGNVLSACEDKITRLTILTVRPTLAPPQKEPLHIQCTRETRLVIANE